VAKLYEQFKPLLSTNMIEWLNNFFGIKNEVSVPTLISLIVFIVGGFINYIFLKIREFTDRKINRNTFYVLIDQIISDLKIKEKKMTAFYPKITITNEENWQVQPYPISYLDTILESEFKEIYYSQRIKFYWCFFSYKVKNKAFHRIFAILKNLKYFEDILQTFLNDFTTNYGKSADQYKESLETYRTFYINNILLETKETDKSQTVLKTLIDKQILIWNNWTDIGEKKTTYYNSYHCLVLPLLESNRGSDMQLAIDGANLLLKCESDYHKLFSILRNYQNQFKNYSDLYRRNARILIKCRSIIK
jgi:hypothetical protein